MSQFVVSLLVASLTEVTSRILASTQSRVGTNPAHFANQMVDHLTARTPQPQHFLDIWKDDGGIFAVDKL